MANVVFGTEGCAPETFQMVTSRHPYSQPCKPAHLHTDLSTSPERQRDAREPADLGLRLVLRVHPAEAPADEVRQRGLRARLRPRELFREVPDGDAAAAAAAGHLQGLRGVGAQCVRDGADDAAVAAGPYDHALAQGPEAADGALQVLEVHGLAGPAPSPHQRQALAQVEQAAVDVAGAETGREDLHRQLVVEVPHAQELLPEALAARQRVDAGTQAHLAEGLSELGVGVDAPPVLLGEVRERAPQGLQLRPGALKLRGLEVLADCAKGRLPCLHAPQAGDADASPHGEARRARSGPRPRRGGGRAARSRARPVRSRGGRLRGGPAARPPPPRKGLEPARDRILRPNHQPVRRVDCGVCRKLFEECYCSG